MQLAPRIARSIGWTRAQGAFLDVAAATLAGLGLGHAAGAGRWGGVAGAAAGLLAALRWSAMRAARAIQRARPGLGLALEAYLEGQGGVLRPRLEGWVVARLGRPVWLPGGLTGVGAGLLIAAVGLATPRRPGPVARTEALPAAAAPLAVTARVEPPAYTGWPAAEAVLPRIRGLRGSSVHLEVRTTAGRLTWAEQEGVERELIPTAGRAALTVPLDRSRSLRIAADAGGAVMLLALEAVPDAPPRVTLEAPDSDRMVTGAPGRVALRASAQDDVAVARLGFRWTLAQGHGEGMHFRSGVAPGHSTLQGETAMSTAVIDPAALGMKAGDTLVVWAEASDGNTLDGPGVGRSSARILRWDEAVVDLTGMASGSRVPPPRAQLTERELLARTERLVRSGVRGVQRRARSEALADDQRQIRETFGFFLQTEQQNGIQLDVEDRELGESGDAKARKFLAQAVSEMWSAEAELAAGNPAGAIPPERAAVKALEAAFGTERVSLRALRPPDKPVDDSRRLSGKQVQLRPRSTELAAVERPGTRAVEALARRLLLSAEQGVSPAVARELADAVWALPAVSGIPAAALAGPLYAANDPGSRTTSAREAGAALARWLRPSPVTLPPVSSDEGAVLARLPLSPVPR